MENSSKRIDNHTNIVFSDYVTKLHIANNRLRNRKHILRNSKNE